jgi:hypothetical protein
MVRTEEMIRTHPRIARREGLVECIEAYECAQTCIACADACLAEPNVESLLRCIRLNQDCAAICQATGEVLARQTEREWGVVRAQVAACIEACRACAGEREMHAAHMQHCQVCAEARRRCEDACRRLLSQI